MTLNNYIYLNIIISHNFKNNLIHIIIFFKKIRKICNFYLFIYIKEIYFNNIILFKKINM